MSQQQPNAKRGVASPAAGRNVAVAITYSSSPARGPSAEGAATAAKAAGVTGKSKSTIIIRKSNNNNNNNSAVLDADEANSGTTASGRPSVSAALFAAAAAAPAVASTRPTVAAPVTLLPEPAAESAEPSQRKASKKKDKKEKESTTAATSTSAAATSAAPAAAPSAATPSKRRARNGWGPKDPSLPTRIKIHGAKNILFDTCPGGVFYAAATFGRGALLMSQRRTREIEVEAEADDNAAEDDELELNGLIFGNSTQNATAAADSQQQQRGSSSAAAAASSATAHPTPALALATALSQSGLRRGPNGRPLVKRRVVEKPMLLLPGADGGVVVEDGRTYHVVTLAVNPRGTSSADEAQRVLSAAMPSLWGGDGAPAVDVGECPANPFGWSESPRRRGPRTVGGPLPDARVNSNNSGRSTNRSFGVVASSAGDAAAEEEEATA